MQTRLRMAWASIWVSLSEMAWCLYALVIRPLLPDSMVKAVREFKIGFETTLAFLIVVGFVFQLAALSLVFYLIFFHEWPLSIVMAAITMAAMYGIFSWQDERRTRTEQQRAEKYTAPPAPS